MKIDFSTNKTILAQFVLILWAAGCMSPTLEEDPSDVNLPPHMAAEFLTPAEDVLRVESNDPVVLAVETLLDPNPEEALYYAFVGERSGLIEQATATRRPTDDRYRDIFYLFDRAEVEIDPCAERLRNHDDELIRLFVSDRPFQRVTESGVEIDDQAHLISHHWLLRFRSQICP